MSFLELEHNQVLVTVQSNSDFPTLMVAFQNGMATLKNTLAISLKFCIYLPSDPKIPLQSINPKEMKSYIHTKTYMNESNSSIHNCPKLESTQVSFNG